MTEMHRRLSQLVCILLTLRLARSIPSVDLLPTLCGTTADRSEGSIIKAHAGVDSGAPFPTSISSCIYVIRAADPSQKLRFGIGTGHGEINFITGTPPLCIPNYISVRDSDGLSVLRTPTCGVLDRTDYISSGDSLTIEVGTIGGNDTVFNFTAHYTSFTSGANCSSLFPCNNGRCVASQSRCDPTLINDCGDFSDNSPGPPGNCSAPTTTTMPRTTTPNITTTTTVAAPSPQTDLLWIAGLAGGLAGAYFFYWLLWRPGYLVWRCAGWRHLPCCRNHGLCQRSAPAGGKSPAARWCSCCGESKVSSSGPVNEATKPPNAGNFTDLPPAADGLSTIPENAAVGAGTGMAASTSFTRPPRVSQIEREPHIFEGRKSSTTPPSFIVLS